MDGMHVHRLSVLWPDMYPRLLRVMEAEPIYQDSIVNAVSALMMNCCDHTGGGGRRGHSRSVPADLVTRGGAP